MNKVSVHTPFLFNGIILSLFFNIKSINTEKLIIHGTLKKKISKPHLILNNRKQKADIQNIQLFRFSNTKTINPWRGTSCKYRNMFSVPSVFLTQADTQMSYLQKECQTSINKIYHGQK